jgi:hypothetical protein
MLLSHGSHATSSPQIVCRETSSPVLTWAGSLSLTICCSCAWIHDGTEAVKFKTAFGTSSVASIITNKQQILKFGSFLFPSSFFSPVSVWPFKWQFSAAGGALFSLSAHCRTLLCLSDEKGVHLMGQTCPVPPLKFRIVQGMWVNRVLSEVKHGKVMWDLKPSWQWL